MKSPRLPVTGHDLLAVERFHDDTRHMIEFQVLSEDNPADTQEACVRQFLTEEAYAKALQDQETGRIRIYKHANIIEGHILPDKPKKRRRGAASSKFN